MLGVISLFFHGMASLPPIPFTMRCEPPGVGPKIITSKRSRRLAVLRNT